MSPREESQGLQSGTPTATSVGTCPEPPTSPSSQGWTRPLSVSHLLKRGLGFSDGRAPSPGSPWARPQPGSPPRNATPSFCCSPRQRQRAGGPAAPVLRPTTTPPAHPMAPRVGTTTREPHGDAEVELALRGAQLGLKQLHLLRAAPRQGPHPLRRARGDTHAPPPRPRQTEESPAESPGLEAHSARSTAAFAPVRGAQPSMASHFGFTLWGMTKLLP